MTERGRITSAVITDCPKSAIDLRKSIIVGAFTLFTVNLAFRGKGVGKTFKVFCTGY